jgi:hypothetical protein
MFLKAGVLSLALLLLSRVLGLLRESTLAAAFGASGLGDVAVLMLTLPDWIAGVLASGALAYVLLPQGCAVAAAFARRDDLSRRLFRWGASLGVGGLWFACGLVGGPLGDALAARARCGWHVQRERGGQWLLGLGRDGDGCNGRTARCQRLAGKRLAFGGDAIGSGFVLGFGTAPVVVAVALKAS